MDTADCISRDKHTTAHLISQELWRF